MQPDLTHGDDVQEGDAMRRALTLLAAGAVAAAVGLAAVNVPEADLTPHTRRTDASEQGVRAIGPAETPAAPGGAPLDPALQTIDHGSESHE